MHKKNMQRLNIYKSYVIYINSSSCKMKIKTPFKSMSKLLNSNRNMILSNCLKFDKNWTKICSVWTWFCNEKKEYPTCFSEIIPLAKSTTNTFQVFEERTTVKGGCILWKTDTCMCFASRLQ